MFVLSRILLGLAVFGFIAGLYHLTDGVGLIGLWVLGASISTALLSVVLHGLARAVEALESIEREVSR